MSETEPAAGGQKSKLLVFIVVLVVVAGAAFVMGGRGGASATEAEPEAEKTEEAAAGPVVLIDPTTLSLADGHYLKLGVALQLAAHEEEAADSHGAEAEGPALSAEESARALDEAITIFGSKTMEELRTPEQRGAAKEALVEALQEAYHGEVIGVYFTAFAMQ